MNLVHTGQEYTLKNTGYKTENNFVISQQPRPVALVCESPIASISEDHFDVSSTPFNNAIAETQHFKDSLKCWALKHNVTQLALRDLLALLQPLSLNIPLDPRTQTYQIVGESGRYFHFGVKQGINNALVNINSLVDDVITLTIGIDGVPVSKSPKSEFWPILCIVDQAPLSTPFVAGLYHGSSKPSDLQSYMCHFVEEVKELLGNGVFVNGRRVRVQVRCVIADAPARSFIKACNPYNAYYGCDKCVIKGKWNRKVVFVDVDCPLRTDDDFKEQRFIHHHTGISPFLELGLGMVSQFPIDYLHCVLLGVMRRLIHVWLKGDMREHRIGPKAVRIINLRMKDIARFSPEEFSRKSRSISEIDTWKATELRTFLLYIGPAVLKDQLSPLKFRHFLFFHFAIYVFVSNKARKRVWFEMAERCIRKFVADAAHIYDQSLMTYNFHALCHLPEDVKTFGKLDNFSAFPFENSLQVLKKMLRGKYMPLEQAVNRILERKGFLNHKSHSSPAILNSFILNGCRINAKLRNRACLSTNNEVFIVLEVGHDNNIRCRMFKRYRSLYTHPHDSQTLGVVVVSQLSEEIFSLDISRFKKKVYLVPYRKSEYVATPVI